MALTELPRSSMALLPVKSPILYGIVKFRGLCILVAFFFVKSRIGVSLLKSFWSLAIFILLMQSSLKKISYLRMFLIASNKVISTSTLQKVSKISISSSFFFEIAIQERNGGGVTIGVIFFGASGYTSLLTIRSLIGMITISSSSSLDFFFEQPSLYFPLLKVTSLTFRVFFSLRRYFSMGLQLS